MLRDFFSLIETDSSKCCYGVDQTMAMFHNSGINKLFVYENIEIRMLTMVDPDDEEENEHIFYVDPNINYNQDKFKSKISGTSFLTLSKLFSFHALMLKNTFNGTDLKKSIFGQMMNFIMFRK